MKQRLTIEVRGKQHQWSFETYADPRYLPEWQADGLQISILENTIPSSVVSAGLTRPWCWLQDAWKFLRLW